MNTKSNGKSRLRNLFLLVGSIFAFCALKPNRVVAQTFTTIHNFGAYTSNGDWLLDGFGPDGSLTLSGNTLYGTTESGGIGPSSAGSLGTVFSLNTDGTGEDIIYSYNSVINPGDGPIQMTGLALFGNTLYAIAANDGYADDPEGMIFAINADGSNLQLLHLFTGIDGSGLGNNQLLVSGNIIYGLSEYAGSNGFGTLFSINTDGTGIQVLHYFNNPAGNYDGATPAAGLILSGNTLYGTSSAGGSFNAGTVFSLNTDGAEYTTLHNFDITNGVAPMGSLILSGSTLYGTTRIGQPNVSSGTVFAVETNGTGFRILHSFSWFNVKVAATNIDGGWPRDSQLVLSGNTLYGTTSLGGTNGNGTAFSVNTDGTSFQVLHTFGSLVYPPHPETNSDGANPMGGVILSGNNLYGTTQNGGIYGGGTMFSITLPMQPQPPQLAISRLGTKVVLTWPTNPPGFNLQSTPNLLPATWNTNLPMPTAISGQFTVTNPISGTQMFYRLVQ